MLLFSYFVYIQIWLHQVMNDYNLCYTPKWELKTLFRIQSICNPIFGNYMFICNANFTMKSIFISFIVFKVHTYLQKTS
jgi:hypothetical protein